MIVISGHGRDGPKLARKVFTEGAVDFVNKPFPATGETLDEAIRQALRRQRCRRRQAVHSESKDEVQPSRFQGGPLVFERDCVRLCGVKIISDKGTGQSIMILEHLRQTDAQGRFVRYPAQQLAQAIRAPGGIKTITNCIAGLRRNIVERLQQEQKVVCGPEDVIVHDEQGYHLHDCIRIIDDKTAAAGSATGEWNHRQRWLLAELEQGAHLDRQAFQQRFGIAEKTAKRDLRELREAGRITFVRRPGPGHYRLAER